MTEKEKAACGMLYDANNDAELQQEMLETRIRLHEFNQLSPREAEKRDAVLRSLLHVGCNCTILSPFHCDYGYNIHIGDNFFANVNLVILDGARLTIGDNVFIGPNVCITTAGHPLESAPRNAGLEYAHPIVIGNSVWIGAGVQILSSGPIGQWHNISMMFDKAISSAKKCVYIETPYFLPTESLLRSLQTAALSKVDVRIIVPRTPDSRMLKLATASYIGECLRAGIKFYYYEPGMLHSKNIIIDEEFTTTGSTNFDFRSMEYNFECNAFIYSREINAKMKEIFMTDLGESTRILSSTWKQRPFLQKLKESLVRLMSPVL